MGDGYRLGSNSVGDAFRLGNYSSSGYHFIQWLFGELGGINSTKALDQSGYNLHGELCDSNCLLFTGVVDAGASAESIEFDHDDSYFLSGPNEDAPFALAVRFNVEDLSATRTLLSKWNGLTSNTDKEWTLDLQTNGRLRLTVADWDAAIRDTAYRECTTGLSVNTDYAVVVNYDGALGFTIYVNGDPVAMEDAVIQPDYVKMRSFEAVAVKIGGQDSSNDHESRLPFKGKIWDARIWRNYNLSADEATAYYLGKINIANSRLVLFAPCAEGARNVVYNVAQTSLVGNNNGSTKVTYSTQDTFHYNIHNGFDYYEKLQNEEDLVLFPANYSGDGILGITFRRCYVGKSSTVHCGLVNNSGGAITIDSVELDYEDNQSSANPFTTTFSAGEIADGEIMWGTITFSPVDFNTTDSNGVESGTITFTAVSYTHLTLPTN